MELLGYPIYVNGGGVQGIINCLLRFFPYHKIQKTRVIFGEAKILQILEVKPTELTGALQWAADGAWVMRRRWGGSRVVVVGWLVGSKNHVSFH